MHYPTAFQNTALGFHFDAHPNSFPHENTSLFGHASFTGNSGNFGDSASASSDLSIDHFDVQEFQAGWSRDPSLPAQIVPVWAEELALSATVATQSDLAHFRQLAAGDVLTGMTSAAALIGSTEVNSAASRLVGTLERTDPNNPLRNGSFYDGYSLSGLANRESVQVQVNSSELDTYLQIVNANTGSLVAFDDDSGPSRNSQLTFVAQAGVNYIIQVTSYAPGETGNYTLSTSADDVSPVPKSDSPSPGVNGAFSNVYGYGQIDAAALVATALGQSAFNDVPNLGGDAWGLDQVRAPEVWAQGYTGQDVVVAVLDTGVDYNHVDLVDNIWVNTDEIANNGVDDDGNGYVDDIRGWDFAYDDNSPMDRDGHGTHVAGTVAATGTNRAIGVAPDATILPVQVLDDEGGGFLSDIADGIIYAVDNGADVINLSLGGDFSSVIRNAIRYAWEQGVAVIMASGNEYSFQPGFPARHATNWGIAVGAVDINRRTAPFSNLAGSTVLDYVVAPGVDIVSTTPGDRYEAFSGTSMAAPHAAGVAALLLSAVPTLTVNQLENLIIDTANPAGITT